MGQVTTPLPQVSEPDYDTRNNKLLLAALAQISETVQRCLSIVSKQRVGVVIGTSTSGIAEAENFIRYSSPELKSTKPGEPNPTATDDHTSTHSKSAPPPYYHFRQQQLSSGADFIARHLDIRGPCISLSTACSSSANAFASARNLLELDLCDAVIVGGADSLCKLTVQGFAALEAVSDAPANPFSINRNGINIGEGAALFIMTNAKVDASDKLKNAVSLLGVGSSSDAHHISAPHPQGRGAIAAISATIQEAGLQPGEIDYVNLHGTATALNDAMEAEAIAGTVGLQVPCSSTKALTGHTLGAAGAIESALCWLSLNRDVNPQRLLIPHVWDQQADPDIPNIMLTKPGESNPSLQYCLSNSFAFGGNNASVLLGIVDP